ncbi:hypothetical protein Pla175_33660 [Pirellulimonas nuda]|uniref:Alpha/beta hydrolase family protein n=1 Tax=Pirellulimonas nuda TaxID=2528009 RepID=A0A518DER4_9BACT|nr:hypothetical protein [Pirellulimonas nuda]QDU89968.1 hypothetical protein Pla175_33660 [Pirellulimonas nuda]
MPNHPAWRLALCALLCVAPCALARAQGAASVPCAVDDEVLILDLRQIGCSTDPGRAASHARVLRRDASGRFCGTTLDALVAGSDPGVPTVLYTHGNRVEPNEVAPFGMRVYRRLTACRRNGQPIRYVMVSWNSDQERGLLNDIRTKASRTDSVAWQLAWVIDQLPPETPLGLMGYSFGARISTGAAHLLAGGSLGGVRLDSQTGCAKRPIESVLVAAAIDKCWLGPGQRQGLAMQQIDHLLVSMNQRDPAMRFYPYLYRSYNPESIGYSGPTCLSADYASRMQKCDLTSSVGTTHDLDRYLQSPGFAWQAWRRLSFEQRPDAIASRPIAEGFAGAVQ